jgi:hypothetical protein
LKELIKKYLLVEKGMPEGWDDKSIAKLSDTIGKKPDEKGFFDACVIHLSKHMDDQTAKGLCANIKDTGTGSTYWRGKDKPESQAKQDITKHQNVKK